MALNRAVFLDKDGTLVEDVPYNVDPAKLSWCDGAIASLQMLQASDYKLFVITNQSGVARGYFPETALLSLAAYMRSVFEVSNITLSGFYYCPHHPDGTVTHCATRVITLSRCL